MFKNKLLPLLLLFVIFGFEFDVRHWLDAFSIGQWFESKPRTGEPIVIPA